MSSSMWGGAAKIYTASRAYYEHIVAACPDLFPRMIDVFHMAVAIGILRDTRKPFHRDGPEIGNMYSVDPNEVLGPLLSERFPQVSATDRYVMLLELAEAGVEVIYNEVQLTATFDPTVYLADGRNVGRA